MARRVLAVAAKQANPQMGGPAWIDPVPRTTPYEAVQSALEPALGARVASLPRKWELLGDVLVVRFADGFSDDEKHVAAAQYAEALRARIVLEDLGGIAGPLRLPQVRRLFGEGSAETTVVQGGIRYTLDPERVMFSSGNIDERLRMGQQAAAGETVVDLFAGIGYFTIPLLKQAGAERVIACELNPDSARFLKMNAESNKVTKRLEVREGDCREVAPVGVADRVLSGYFPHGHRFLPTALAALKPTGGLLHYHESAHASDPDTELRGYVESALSNTPFEITNWTMHAVKSYSPKVIHAVVDVEVRP